MSGAGSEGSKGCSGVHSTRRLGNRSQAMGEKKDIRQFRARKQKERGRTWEKNSPVNSAREGNCCMCFRRGGRGPGPSREHGDKTTRIGSGLPPIKTRPPPQRLIILQTLSRPTSIHRFRTLTATRPALVVAMEQRTNDGYSGASTGQAISQSRSTPVKAVNRRR